MCYSSADVIATHNAAIEAAWRAADSRDALLDEPLSVELPPSVPRSVLSVELSCPLLDEPELLPMEPLPVDPPSLLLSELLSLPELLSELLPLPPPLLLPGAPGPPPALELLPGVLFPPLALPALLPELLPEVLPPELLLPELLLPLLLAELLPELLLLPVSLLLPEPALLPDAVLPLSSVHDALM